MIGIPEIFPLFILFGVLVVPITGGIILLWVAYLRAAPRTDAEKRAAADLALKGAVICLLGLLFPPVLLVGLFPLFYGVRKVMYASMGLVLVDDAVR